MNDPAVEAAQRAWTGRYSDRVVPVTDSAHHDGMGALAIAAAREALKSVRELHRPQVIDCLAPNCADEVCDHEDECPADHPVTVCAHCWEVVSDDPYYGEGGITDRVFWPCDTALLVYTTEELEP